MLWSDSLPQPSSCVPTPAPLQGPTCALSRLTTTVREHEGALGYDLTDRIMELLSIAMRLMLEQSPRVLLSMLNSTEGDIVVPLMQD